MKTMSFRRMASCIFALVAALILVTSCGSVPLTGRKQVLLVSDQEVYEAGLTQYKEYMEDAVVSTDSRKTSMVKSVGRKLSEATEKYLRANGFESEIKNLQWEFNLVKSNEVNAFCMPGGKIVVYEGLFAVADTEAELAVVLGHEIAHAVAKHSNERMSQQIMTQYGMLILSDVLSEKSDAVRRTAKSVFGLGAQIGIMLPYSRKHEYEADYMGIVFMEMAGYDSASAVDFWTKMSTGGGKSSDFFSTHPSDSKRVAEITRRIPEAKSVASKY